MAYLDWFMAEFGGGGGGGGPGKPFKPLPTTKPNDDQLIAFGILFVVSALEDQEQRLALGNASKPSPSKGDKPAKLEVGDLLSETAVSHTGAQARWSDLIFVTLRGSRSGDAVELGARSAGQLSRQGKALAVRVVHALRSLEHHLMSRGLSLDAARESAELVAKRLWRSG